MLDIGTVVSGTVVSGDLPAILAGIVADARGNGLDHPAMERMVEILEARAGRCSGVLSAMVKPRIRDLPIPWAPPCWCQ